jgi:hypothetical protein
MLAPETGKSPEGSHRGAKPCLGDFAAGSPVLDRASFSFAKSSLLTPKAVRPEVMDCFCSSK